METDETPTHGLKRSAEDGLEGEQRLSKRFNLLNLEHNGKLFIPVDHRAPPRPTEEPMKIPLRQENNKQDPDWMQVEDQKDKVFIHNLDDELSSDEEVASQDRIVFLPDIEKRLAKIPQHILRGDTEAPKHLANELVLYSVPRSITVSEDKDSVRKAILESRARARQESQQRADGTDCASQDALLHDDDDDDDENKSESKDNDRHVQFQQDQADAMDTE